MSFLKDKEWEKMDWLNKAVEPYTFSLNVELAKIPSEYTLSYREIVHFIQKDMDIRLRTVVYQLAERSGISKNSLSIIDTIGYSRLFELRLEADTEVDIDNEVVRGGVRICKTMESLSDEMIEEILPMFVVKMNIHDRKVSTQFVNDVMDILDCKEGRSSSSVKKKCASLQQHIYNIYRNNTWNIRNVDLAIKMLTWIKSYCERGDRCSLANLSKLKCMIHNGHPIYSMEEIE